jgi:c-di-GMP-binding flagellar brake protein YcgR
MKDIVKPGNKVELIPAVSLRRKEEIVYITKIEEVMDDKKLLIATPISEGQIVPIQINGRCVVTIYGSRGLFQCKVKVVDRIIKGTMRFLLVERISEYEKVQRREFFRLKSVIPFRFKKDEIWNEGIIKDISGGGIRFITNTDLDSNNEILCEIPLEEQLLSIPGIILLKEYINLELYQYQYRIQFTQLKRMQREAIIQYIFQQQRRLVQREKGL